MYLTFLKKPTLINVPKANKYTKIYMQVCPCTAISTKNKFTTLNMK